VGGRKVILTPSGGTAWAPRQTRIDNALIKAIARAHRWKQMMESGTYASVTELAAAEKINQSYLCRVLRLTLLAPDIVEMILDGQQGVALQLDALLRQLDTLGALRLAQLWLGAENSADCEPAR
jgi:hypothetical protein